MKLETYQKIRLLRESKGLTQIQFADYIGMSASSYSKYEQGITSITIPLLRIFAKGLNVKTYELLPDSEEFIQELQTLRTENETLKKLLK
jgi:transcriptional regulator with XRE-family HTH domain